MWVCCLFVVGQKIIELDYSIWKHITVSKEIVQKTAKKYILIGFILLICIPLLLLLVGLCLFHTEDIPLRIGGDKDDFVLKSASLLLSICIGAVLMKYMGKWAGKNYEKKAGNGFKICALTLGITFVGTMIPLLNILFLATGIFMAAILAVFMNREIKREMARERGV